MKMTVKMTSKGNRKYSVDFSEGKHGKKTDASFAASCDVNNIVRHYEMTGIDPYVDRKLTQRFGDASPLSYEDAMRHVSEINSAFADLPARERAKHWNDPAAWLEYLSKPNVPSEASASAKPPPEDSTDAKPVEKVQ